VNLLQDKYKLSQYNVFHDDGDIRYMWNTYSNALLKLDKQSQEYVNHFNDNSSVDDGSNEFKLLKDNGFIIFEKLDELGRIRLHEKQKLFSHATDGMSVVIAPGMGCNYSCSYCFEKQSNKLGVMTLDTASAVALYICNQLKGNSNIKHLDILWFGGEPLLYMDAVQAVSREVLEFTKKHDIKYSAGITTNGRFLDGENLKKIQEFGIANAQITLDGMCESYCKSKGATTEDFNKVIENILFASDKIRISIRLNIVNNNADEAIKITDLLGKSKFIG